MIVTTVNLAVFVDIFFFSLITPVLPFALSAQVGVPEDTLQYWISILLAAYGAALFVASPIVGIYADHTSSRKWPLLLGLIALAGASLLLAFGNSIGLFVLGRVLQGVSAAVVWSVGCALLVDTMGSNVGVAMGRSLDSGLKNPRLRVLKLRPRRPLPRIPRMPNPRITPLG